MRTLLLLVFLFNVLDASLTSYVITAGLATEANPLMGAILEHGIVPFVVCKLSLVIMSIVVLWKFRFKKIARYGTLLCFAVYSWLLLYFAFNFSSL